MDLRERLSDDDLAHPGYLAASHLHRYALAAELCAGLRVLDVGCGTGYGTESLAGTAASVHGVDVDAGSVALARRERTGGALTFAVADAHDHLRQTGAGDIDAVVMFETLEHVADPEAVLEELARLAAAGVRLIVSVPNSRAFRERNPFHLSDFGYAEARGAFARFGDDVTLLYQVLAEGSLILGDDARPDAFRARAAALEQAEPEYANAFIAVAGFGPAAAAEATAELALMATPAHNRYMLELERANQEYFRANRLLARQVYGKHDAAAAGVIVRLEAVERNAAELERALMQERAWHDAARYRIADRVVTAAGRIPLVKPLGLLCLRVLRRARGGRPPQT